MIINFFSKEIPIQILIHVFITFFFNSHDRYKIDQVINEMGVNASESDIEILKQVCTAVSIRAARLAAAGIAGIVKV